MESADVQVVAFDAEQMFAVGRALKAIADEVFENPKIEAITYQQDEIIELLSDSENAADNDDGSDCEIFGQICTNAEDLQDNMILESCNQSAPVDSQAAMKSENCNQKPARLENDAADNIADRAVFDSDAAVFANISYREELSQRKSTKIILSNDIIVLDDDDDEGDPPCNENGEEDNNNGNNTEYSEEEEKEKKCIDLLDMDSEECNQPSTSNDKNRQTNLNTFNLEAFLIYLCPQCGVSCDNIKKWNAHTDIVHNFRSISKLNLKTVISRQGVLSYQCNTCDRQYNSDTSHSILLNHRIQHMTIPEFLRCRLCEERFTSRQAFLKHFKKRHKKVALQKLIRTESIRKHIRFMCPICKAKSKNLKAWWDHLEDDHDWCNKISEKVTTIRDNLVECQTCAATFRTRQNKWHSLRHELNKPFQCKLCKNISSHDLSIIGRHIRVEHLKEALPNKEYRCNYCDKIFVTHSRRITHLLEMHTIEELVCEVCGKKYKSSAGLLTHMTKQNHRKMK